MNDRREQLVQALVRLVAAQGHLDVPVTEIAREAGLAPGLVHYYFPRKLDLVLALVEDAAEALERRLQGRADASAVVEACLARGDDEQPARIRVWSAITASAARDPEVREAWGRGIRSLLDRLRTQLDEPQALLALAAITGFWQLGAADPSLIPTGAAAPATLAVLRGRR